jgi:dTDP-4-amino-4,6-dideoxygalactose transaminase
MVKFFDLQRAHGELAVPLREAVDRVMAAGHFILGPEVEAFEREFAAFCGTDHCIGVGNGLDALHLLLRAMGIGEGDEVLVPSHTFIATWLAVNQAGAIPVPVEPDPGTYNLDAARIAAAIGPRTRAIIAVHLYGQPAQMAALRGIARTANLLIIEDAAQAHGATFRDRRAGNLGDGAAFSFYPSKNLGALGDGGAVATNDAAIADRVRQLRNYGSSRKYQHDIAGFNSRLDPLQAAFLRAKLPYLEAWNARRRDIAARYLQGLAGTSLKLPAVALDCMPVWHQFVIRSDRRDELQAHLLRAGVETLVHYPLAPHLQPAYRAMGLRQGALPVAEMLQAQVLSLPMHPHLDDGEVDYVIDACRAFKS